MIVLQVTSHLNIGGISRYIIALSRELAARSHAVRVASGGGELEPELRALGVPHWTVPLNTSADISLQVARAARQLLRRLRAEPVDLLHAHTRASQVAAAYCARALGVPYVTTWHGLYRPNLGRALWPCAGARTIAISEPVSAHLTGVFRVPAARVRLVLNGVDPDYFAAAQDPSAVAAFRQAHGLPADAQVIGSVGRLTSGGVKGFDMLLALARRLLEELPRLHVLIVGDGPRRRFLEHMAGTLGLRTRVHFTGPVHDVRIPLALMEVFVFPVRWQEGFGLSLIEAMAAGRPVVATRTGAVPDILGNGTGLLADPEDVPALAAAVRRLVQDRELAVRLGEAGRARVRDTFSLSRMAEQVEAVYREVIPA